MNTKPLEQQKKQSIGFIPAHLASKRLPNKVLLPLGDNSILERVYRRACLSNLDQVKVVTDSEDVYQHVIDFGGQCILSSTYSNGTKRCVHTYLKEKFTEDILINIQADEPFIDPNDINALIQLISRHQEPIIGTLGFLSTDLDQYNDPNVVKIALDQNQRAMYFSRSAIPHYRDHMPHTPIRFVKHKGVYGFHAALLSQIASLDTSPLESTEKLEQLTWLFNDLPVYVELTEHDSSGIDTPEDYQLALQSIT